MSNPKWFKYEWIWEKKQGTGSFNANRRPMSSHENILIFSSGSPVYYPQKHKADKLLGDTMPNISNLEYTSIYRSGSDYKNKQLWKETGYRYPKTVLKFSNHNGCCFGARTAEAEIKHPTKKPIPLIEYLLKTYSLKGSLILDNTAGSGTLAIAAINTDRNYICIEKDEHYFEVMRDRIKNHDPNAIKPQPKLPKKKPINNEYIQLSLFSDCLDSL